MPFDMTGALRPDLPPAADVWVDPPDHSFVGGHNCADTVPFAALAEAAVNAIGREGRNLASYNLGGSPLGYRPLREFVADAMGRRAATPVDPEQVLITSGSLQALDLVNRAFLTPGDTVVIEQATYGGTITRLADAGARWVGVALDDDGIIPEDLDRVLTELAAAGTRPRYVYTVPTIQNPTGSILPEARRLAVLDIARRHGVPIFEDDCYADLVWDGARPPTFRALDDGGGQVIYCGSFSKSIAPALRVGYLIGDQLVIQQLLALKTDAGTGAMEQLTVAEFAPPHFDAHVDRLIGVLRHKCDTMVAAVAAAFGDDVQIVPPKGGIYVWLTFPEGVDTSSFVDDAAAAGIEFNPGRGWAADPAWGARRLRLCFGHVDVDRIESGVAQLAEVYRTATDR
ncbi:MAG: PLP-dependent aminotransferase family protein [Actinomycetota bacterium]